MKDLKKEAKDKFRATFDRIFNGVVVAWKLVAILWVIFAIAEMIFFHYSLAYVIGLTIGCALILLAISIAIFLIFSLINCVQMAIKMIIIPIKIKNRESAFKYWKEIVSESINSGKVTEGFYESTLISYCKNNSKFKLKNRSYLKNKEFISDLVKSSNILMSKKAHIFWDEHLLEAVQNVHLNYDLEYGRQTHADWKYIKDYCLKNIESPKYTNFLTEFFINEGMKKYINQDDVTKVVRPGNIILYAPKIFGGSHFGSEVIDAEDLGI